MTHQSVLDAWRAWNEPLEGCVSWMYLDTHRPPLVTTGMGNLIDPVELALALPWCDASGAPASPDDVGAEWRHVKSMPWLSNASAAAAERATTLRLTDEAIDGLISDRLAANTAILVERFPDFDLWPADAQLGLLSMAWAMGPGFPVKFPKFSAACDAQDFVTAAAECQMGGSPPPDRRNRANEHAFGLAAEVLARGLSASVLYSAVPPAA